MPTHDEYTEAAARFRALGRRLDDLVHLPESFHRSTAFGDGPVRDALADSMTSVASDVRVASDECRRLAETCDVRAAVCNQYRRDVNRYVTRRLIDPLVTRPVRPATWVDL